jgi:hypothetical protein
MVSSKLRQASTVTRISLSLNPGYIPLVTGFCDRPPRSDPGYRGLAAAHPGYGCWIISHLRTM